jgi:hypothetical protein
MIVYIIGYWNIDIHLFMRREIATAIAFSFCCRFLLLVAVYSKQQQETAACVLFGHRVG